MQKEPLRINITKNIPSRKISMSTLVVWAGHWVSQRGAVPTQGDLGTCHSQELCVQAQLPHPETTGATYAHILLRKHESFICGI